MLRGVLVAVAAWVSVVVAGSTMAWATINTAGQEVLSRGGVPTPRSTTPTPTASPRSSRPAPTEAPSSGPPTSTATQPTGRTHRRRTPTPQPTSAPAPQPTRPAPSARPASGPRTDTWRGRAGSVTVRCDGSSISLQAASPNDGYEVEVHENGPEEVEVRFRYDDGEARVESQCSGGRADFSVRS